MEKDILFPLLFHVLLLFLAHLHVSLLQLNVPPEKFLTLANVSSNVLFLARDDVFRNTPLSQSFLLLGNAIELLIHLRF